MLGLVLLLGLIGGVALTAAAGARRTDTAYPRLLSWANASQLDVVPQGTGLTGYYAALARLPEVSALGTGQLYEATMPGASHADPRRQLSQAHRGQPHRNEAGMTEAQEVRRGYEQFVPPQPPPGMYFDPASELILPHGVPLASRRQVARAWLLGLLLFSVTLGIGYITWSLFTWGQGRTPAQRILSLRCWLPGPRRVAGRKQTAQRQITGFFLNGQLLSGFFIWLTSKDLRSVGDFFASTVILHDPDGVLQLSSAASPGPHPALQIQTPEVPVSPPGRPPSLCGGLRGTFTARLARQGPSSLHDVVIRQQAGWESVP